MSCKYRVTIFAPGGNVIFAPAPICSTLLTPSGSVLASESGKHTPEVLQFLISIGELFVDVMIIPPVVMEDGSPITFPSGLERDIVFPEIPCPVMIFFKLPEIVNKLPPVT